MKLCRVPAIIDGLGGVLDLENTSIGRECSDRQVVTCSYAAHSVAAILFLREFLQVCYRESAARPNKESFLAIKK